MDVDLVNVPKSVTVLLKFNAPAPVNVKLAVQFIVPSASNVPVDTVTVPELLMAVVPFTSIVLLPTANTVEAAVTVKSPPTFVELERVFVAPPEITK